TVSDASKHLSVVGGPPQKLVREGCLPDSSLARDENDLGRCSPGAREQLIEPLQLVAAAHEGLLRPTLDDTRSLPLSFDVEHVSAARNRPDVPPPGIAQGATHVSYALRERIVADERVGPERLEQLVLRHHSAAVRNEVAERVE